MTLQTILKSTLRISCRSLPYLYLASMFTLVMSGYSYADGTDYLSGAWTSVNTTFGESSSFMKIVYVAEVGAIAFAWVKTKSPMVLLGLPILLLATHFFFGSITA